MISDLFMLRLFAVVVGGWYNQTMNPLQSLTMIWMALTIIMYACSYFDHPKPRWALISRRLSGLTAIPFLALWALIGVLNGLNYLDWIDVVDLGWLDWFTGSQ